MEQLATAALLANMLSTRLERADAFRIAGVENLGEPNIRAAFERFDELAAVMAEIKSSMESEK